MKHFIKNPISKHLLIFLLVAVSSLANAQINAVEKSILGKWKPISFNIGQIAKAAVTDESVTFIRNLDSLVATDKDPEMSKILMGDLFEGLLRKMKTTVIEFKNDSIYTETNTQKMRERSGKYFIGKHSDTLTINMADDNDQLFSIRLDGKTLILTQEMSTGIEKKLVLEIKYERE